MGAGGAGVSSAASRLGIRVAILGVIAGLALGVDAVADRTGDAANDQAASPTNSTGSTSITPDPTVTPEPASSPDPTPTDSADPTPTPTPTTSAPTETPTSRGPARLPGAISAGVADRVRVDEVWVSGFDPGDGQAGVVLWRANNFVETASGGADGQAWIRLRQQRTGALVRITFKPERGLHVSPLNDALTRVVESRPMPDGARALVSVQSGR